jgi:hypothetical protein
LQPQRKLVRAKRVPADDLRSLISDKENLRNLSKKKASLDIGIAANKSALLYLKQRTINLFQHFSISSRHGLCHCGMEFSERGEKKVEEQLKGKHE